MNIGLLSLAIAVGQPTAWPPGHSGPPIVPAAPFLFVTVSAPGDSKVTWQPMSSEATVTNGPVGLRPGYFHRFQVSDIPDTKSALLYPSIEVRGTLIPRRHLDVTKHPVPITLTDRDIDQVLDGRLVTKVYYLEDPDQAVPVQGRPGEALEATALTEEAAIKEARLRGRPMLIVRVGERPFTKDELARENVPGTILFPGSRTVPIPAAPPVFHFGAVPLFDPLHGPKAAAEECLRDGSDVGPILGEGPGRTIGGLDPTDTAMMFTTRLGTQVIHSNRICICVPRFAAARVDVGPHHHHVIRAPQGHHLIKPTAALDVRMTTGVITGGEHLAGIIGSLRASGIQSHVGPVALVDLRGRPLGLSNVRGTAVVAQVRGPEEITSYCGCTLLLEKSIDPTHPEKIGDVVTVTLKFTNPTTETMSDIVIADSLTPRLEYIEGSAKSDRATTFTTVPNGVGSVVLRWAVDGKLMPGEIGKITFRVRIR
jgi:uncharacterized repeat protein (TIGR01451 family)